MIESKPSDKVTHDTSPSPDTDILPDAATAALEEADVPEALTQSEDLAPGSETDAQE